MSNSNQFDPNKKTGQGGANSNNNNFSSFDWPSGNTQAPTANPFDWGSTAQQLPTAKTNIQSNGKILKFIINNNCYILIL